MYILNPFRRKNGKSPKKESKMARRKSRKAPRAVKRRVKSKASFSKAGTGAMRLSFGTAKKAKASIRKLSKTARKHLVSVITERTRYRGADIRRGPKAVIDTSSSNYQARVMAKKHGKKSFRPRLYFYKGRLFASPRSDGTHSYAVNPKKGAYKMAKRRKSRRVKVNPRKKAYRRNPSMAISNIASKGNLVSALSLGGGFIVGIKAQKYLHGLSFAQPWRKFNGVVPVLLGIVLALKGKQEVAKKIGWGIATSGIYDLVSQNVPQLALMTVEGVDLDGASFDAPVYGEQIFDVNGEQVYDTSMMGADTVVVGNTEIVGEGEPGAGMYSF